jgi:catechol 2,3-dioxygenase-like lactoylglutathione lyase family enzyme
VASEEWFGKTRFNTEYVERAEREEKKVKSPASLSRVVRILIVMLFLAGTVCTAKEAAVRPKILRISEVRVSVSDLAAAQEFYSDVTGQDLVCHWCENSPPRAVFPSGQVLHIMLGEPAAHSSRVVEVVFAVDDLRLLKSLLEANQVAFKEAKLESGIPFVLVLDPEGNALRFMPNLFTARVKVLGQEEKPSTRPQSSVPKRLIHAGFVVHDRAAMDHFYQDILGFHLYWSGGMKDNETDWVDMQVPNGTDWIEYMLNVPENADKHLLGIMNHIALGVSDVREAARQLEAKGMKLPEPPQIGRDGKWQLNLYDPDGTRVEFMKFAPVEKPCCSEYTGSHPKP